MPKAGHQRAASLPGGIRYACHVAVGVLLVSLCLRTWFMQGLMVPVIRDADQKDVYELAAELGELSAAARDGKLKADQLQGATFTISSLGGIGGTAFTPIVNAPEFAILGVSRSSMQPVWNGAEFEPRLMLPLSLSYDHRVIDGAAAVRFTTFLGQQLSDVEALLQATP